MIPFKRLELARRQEVFDWFHQAGRLGCEYSFVNLYLWGRQHAAFVEGYLVVFSHFYGHSMYLFPSGKRMGGRAAMARAMATRCCWPPDIWPGR